MEVMESISVSKAEKVERSVTKGLWYDQIFANMFKDK